MKKYQHPSIRTLNMTASETLLSGSNSVSINHDEYEDFDSDNRCNIQTGFQTGFGSNPTAH